MHAQVRVLTLFLDIDTPWGGGSEAVDCTICWAS